MANSPEQIRENAMLYAMGALDGGGRDAFERLLASGDPLATAEAQAALAAAEALTSSYDTRPRPALKDRLLATVAATAPGGFEQPEPGVSILKLGRGKWKQTPHPGVTVKTLHADRDNRMLTSILRLEAGAKYPAHKHHAVEQCLVLSGDVRLGDNPALHIFAGDYEKAEPGTLHGEITSETGCELLIISCMDDEYVTA